MKSAYVVLAALGITLLLGIPVGANTPASPPAVQEEAHFLGLIEKTAYFSIRGEKVSFPLPETDKELQSRLPKFNNGDVLILQLVKEKDKPDVLKNVSVKTVAISRLHRIAVLFVSAVVVLIVLAILLRGRLRLLLVGKDNRYSNSKFQMTVWFALLLTTYVAALWLRLCSGGGDFIGGVNIPENLLLLSGISAFTFAASKGITASNVSTAGRAAEEAARRAKPDAAQAEIEARVRAAENNVKPPATEPSFPFDLLNDDQGKPDIGDVQMLIITSLAVVVYFALAFKFLGAIELLKVVTLPDVDTTILAAYGFGKGTYVAKKYVSGGKAEA